MSEITVVCFLWRPSDPNDRSFGAEHVNVMHSMLQRNLTIPHKVVCVTDMPEGVRPEVRCVPLDERLVGPKLEWQRFHKLAVWRKDAAEWLGGTRLLLMDLDQVIVDSIDPLVDRNEPVVMWHKWRPKRRKMVYSTSMTLLDAGCRPEVYETFDPQNPPYAGGDQAWVVRAMRDKPAAWAENEGIVNFVKHESRPPKGARVVVLSAGRDPANRPESWVKEYWR